MKRTITLALCAIAALITSLFPGCQKNDHPTSDLTANITPEKQLEYKIAFAKTLAIAVTSSDFRNFLKEQALKRFDWDHDVFYPMIKNEKLPNGESIRDHLSNIINANKTDLSLESIERGLPLLNILVPSFEKFSAEQWNTGNEVPLVAVRNKADVNAGKPLLAYDSDGKPTELDYHEEPAFPVIIIKDNEALEMKGSFGGKQLTPVHKLDQQYPSVLESDGIAYYFADENLYRRLSISSKKAISSFKSGEFTPQTNSTMGIMGTGCERYVDWDRFDVRTREAVDKSIYNPICPDNVATVRDYIYYGIDPTTGVDQGPLRNNYREYITSIRCQSLIARTRFDDVGEGDILEFDITLYTVDNDPVFPLKKTISIPKSEFFYTDANDPNPRPIDLTHNLLDMDPVQLAVWNFKRQGDIWKYAVYEVDPSVTVTESRSISSTLGTNFTIGEEKKGGKFGLTATVNATASSSISFTDASDNLGEAISYWCDPVVIEKFNVTGAWPCGEPVWGVRRPPRGGNFVTVGRSHEINTGTIALTVEPRAL